MGPLGGSSQDTAAKHKHLSELLRPGAPSSTSTATGNPGNTPSLGMMGGLGGPPIAQGLGGPQQQPGMMPQAGMVAGLNRSMMGAHKGNGQPQSMMGGQVMNGAPRMGYGNVNMNAGVAGNGNMLPDSLHQQNAGQQMAQTALRPQQPGAVNKVTHRAFSRIRVSVKCGNLTLVRVVTIFRAMMGRSRYHVNAILCLGVSYSVNK